MSGRRAQIASEFRTAKELFKLDAARWLIPEEVGDVSAVDRHAIPRLLWRNPPLRALCWYRFGGAAMALGVRGAAGWIQRRLLRLYGLEILVGQPTGGGLYIAHPVGCVLVSESIGENVTIISQVTFGTRGEGVWPTIGDRCFFGAGARVLGGVEVGADAKIGANAVVLSDIPAGATAVGIPAKVVEARRQNGVSS
jgi:serine O-acetyltransferase